MSISPKLAFWLTFTTFCLTNSSIARNPTTTSILPALPFLVKSLKLRLIPFWILSVRFIIISSSDITFCTIAFCTIFFFGRALITDRIDSRMLFVFSSLVGENTTALFLLSSLKQPSGRDEEDSRK